MANPIKAKCAEGYCEVPGGSFKMGVTPKGSRLFKPTAVKTVAIDGFYLGEHEVSQGEYNNWQAIKKDSNADLKAILSGCKDNKTNTITVKEKETEAQFIERVTNTMHQESCHEFQIVQETVWLRIPGNNLPVTHLTFDEKRAYCQDQGGDLPTAAQLHYASRYDNDRKYKKKLIIAANDFDNTQPVTEGYKNDYGIYNLLGNVLETTLDAFEESFYEYMATKNPYNPMTNPDEQSLELSGGSFFRYVPRPHPADRFATIANGRESDVGFRCALPLTPKVEKAEK